MNKILPRTLKGFRDFLPEQARKRQYVIDTLRKVFESYGFDPLETPVLEYQEILLGKYGEEGDKLMYSFETKGNDLVTLRYDQTVPLARVVAQYQGQIPLPFKRYQISNVWRGENTQRGRFREFTQCDIDTVGTSSLLADAEIIEITITALRNLGFEKFKVLINDRNVFGNLVKQGLATESELPAILRAVDKINKIGEKGVLDEIGKLGKDINARRQILDFLENQLPPESFMSLFEYLKKLDIPETQYEFEPTLARGLDYYTSTIFEIEIEGYDAGSVCGGGRYDNLIGMFAGRDIPAVGCAFGFDRIIEAMDTLDLFPKNLQTVKALVTVFSPELLDESIKVCEVLSENNIGQELYIDPNAKMEKQLKYADQKKIPYVVIIGPKEAETNQATIKDLKTGEQKTVSLDQLPDSIK